MSTTPKSKREQNLEAELKRETDPGAQAARSRRSWTISERTGSGRTRGTAAEVADAEEQKEANIRQRRLEGGSRFNIRYRDRLPDEALTPEGIKAALAEYVTFGSGSRPPRSRRPGLLGAAVTRRSRGRRPRAAQGHALPEADAALGAPVRSAERLKASSRW